MSTIVNAAISLRVPDDCPRIIEWIELLHAEIAGDPQWSGELANTWAQSGRCRLAQGHVREAVALEKRAAEHRKQAGFVDSTILPELQFALAKVLYRQRRNQAVGYALGALEYTRRIDHSAAKALAAELGHWLERRGVEVPPPSPPDAVKPAP